jgi:hypothetical protein
LRRYYKQQKQEAGELANAGNPNFTIVPGENNSPQTLPDIGVTRKESSTQKQEAGELARQKDGAIYWKSNRDLLPDEEKVMFKLPQTFADIGVTWGSSSDRSRRRGSWQDKAGIEVDISMYQMRTLKHKPSLISELHGEAHQTEAGGRGVGDKERWI